MVTRYLFIGLFSLGITLSYPISAQSVSERMLGDQLDLYGVLDLFKNSENTEDFERLLNSPTNKVNNLDLNNDGLIDYIRVTDYPDGDNHAIVLQAPVNATEAQDIAVLELEKTADGQAHIQIIGNEDLYGPNYIVEPIEPLVQDSRYSAPASNTTVVVNIWGWRPIQYYYGPVYRPWVSPWSWSYYPTWWRPWSPVGWHVYRPRVYHYHGYCHQVYVRRSPHMQAFYSPRRVSSRYVYNNRGAYYNNHHHGQAYWHGSNHGYNHAYGNKNYQHHGSHPVGAYHHGTSGGPYNHAHSGGTQPSSSGGSYHHNQSGGNYHHSSSGSSYNHAPSGGTNHSSSGGSNHHTSSGGTHHSSSGSSYNHAPSGGSHHSSSGGGHSSQRSRGGSSAGSGGSRSGRR